MTTNRAFAVYHKTFECLLVCSASTREKAIRAAYNAALEAGYKTVSWTDFAAKRASKYDALAGGSRTSIIGYHARGYDLTGNFTGHDQSGCLAGLREHPQMAYKNINAEPSPEGKGA